MGITQKDRDNRGQNSAYHKFSGIIWFVTLITEVTYKKRVNGKVRKKSQRMNVSQRLQGEAFTLGDI